MTESTSKATYAALKDPEWTGRALPPVFTAGDLYEALTHERKNVTIGGVSGFLHKATESGLVKRTGKDGGKICYLVGDQSVVMVVKGAGVGGGHSGPRRSWSPPPEDEVVTIVGLREELLALALKVEKLKPDVGLLSKEELLAELSRRFK